jgi:hypothetical protein
MGLTFQAHAQSARSLLECSLAAFKNVADRCSNILTLKAARQIGYRRQFARLMRPCFRNDYLVGVCVNNQIGIMRNHNHLTLALSIPE